MRSWHAQIVMSPNQISFEPTRAVLLASFALLFGSAALSHQENTSLKVRVAEEQCKVYKQTNAGGIGPFAPGIFNFSESWTLWRSPDGSLEVEGKRDNESRAHEPHSNQFTVRLSSDFRVLSLREFRTLRWRPNSGPLGCEFLPGRLLCTTSAAGPTKNVRLDLPLQDAYGFWWPISAYSLSHITRFAGRTPMSVIPVQMVSIDEPNTENPVFASVLQGHLTYLGHESITIAHRKWRAHKSELRVPLHAPLLIWTSPAGLLLDFAEEDNLGRQREQGMTLVRYQQWFDF